MNIADVNIKKKEMHQPEKVMMRQQLITSELLKVKQHMPSEMGFTNPLDKKVSFTSKI
jgi:type IV secretory pathway component VirB8